MSYPMKRGNKPDELLPEELEVAQALREYETVLDDGDIPLNEFVTIHDLHKAYLVHYAISHTRSKFAAMDPEEVPVKLSHRQFGVALRRVWPGIEAYKVYRMVNGKRRWGFVGVRGPESITVSSDTGRPRTW